ncbi:MAG: ribokinase [Chloroflexota bacterium]|nr:ribokinase [Chloroflexota bacterium]
MTIPLTPRVIVVGSLHVDLIATVETLPGPGESVIGSSFTTAPGGKAGNQAAQVARCGVPVALVGRVGDDAHGDLLREAYRTIGIDTGGIVVASGGQTGASTVLVDATGGYLSAIVPGASATWGRPGVAATLGPFTAAAVLMVQGELPATISLAAARWARERGMTIVSNPSPAPSADDVPMRELVGSSDVVVINRQELDALALLFGVKPPRVERSDVYATATALRAKVAGSRLIVTLGEDGAVMVDPSGVFAVAPYPGTTVVDTVGAGDAFLGAYVAGFVRGLATGSALRYAAVAASLSLRGRGALAAQASHEAIVAATPREATPWIRYR